MANHSNDTLLVTGANGHLGREAVEALLTRGATRIIAGTRDPSALQDFAARGVEIRRLDFDDAESMRSAFAGVDRLLMVSTVAPNRREQQTNAVQAAKAAGVRFIAYTSAPNARPNVDAGGIADHFWTEAAIAASGLDYAILRNHIYTDMLLMSANQAKASGQLFDATDGGGRTYVTRRDTAHTAAGALLQAEGQGIYDVAGPAPLTQEQVAALLSRFTGKPITRLGLSPDQLKSGLAQAGVPPFMADLLVAFDNDAAQGHHAIVNDVVEHFTGRAPQTVEAFLEENRAALGA